MVLTGGTAPLAITSLVVCQVGRKKRLKAVRATVSIPDGASDEPDLRPSRLPGGRTRGCDPCDDVVGSYYGMLADYRLDGTLGFSISAVASATGELREALPTCAVTSTLDADIWDITCTDVDGNTIDATCSIHGSLSGYAVPYGTRRC